MGREDSGTSDSTVGQEAVTQGKRHEGISLVCFNVTRSQSVRGGKKGDSWQGIVSSHWCTCSPGWGACILSVGMLREKENLRFDNYNTETQAELTTLDVELFQISVEVLTLESCSFLREIFV